MTAPTRADLIALLHRARNALEFPGSLLDKWALLHEIARAVNDPYPRGPKRTCWCGEQNCNDHSEFEVGDG